MSQTDAYIYKHYTNYLTAQHSIVAFFEIRFLICAPSPPTWFYSLNLKNYTVVSCKFIRIAKKLFDIIRNSIPSSRPSGVRASPSQKPFTITWSDRIRINLVNLQMILLALRNSFVGILIEAEREWERERDCGRTSIQTSRSMLHDSKKFADELLLMWRWFSQDFNV